MHTKRKRRFYAFCGQFIGRILTVIIMNAVGINTSHLKFKTKDLLQKYLPAIHHRARIVDL